MIGVLPWLVRRTRNLGMLRAGSPVSVSMGCMDASAREKIRRIEGNAKCRHLKKNTHVYLRPRTLYLLPLTHCVHVYSILIHTGKGEGGES
jgi:hypothetical protein